jgi:hypothetical protein
MQSEENNMKAYLDLNRKAPLLTYDSNSKPHEIHIRMPDASELIDIIGEKARTYFLVCGVSLLYMLLFLILPSRFYVQIEQMGSNGEIWVLIGFIAILTAGFIIFLFSGHSKEKILYLFLSVALTICVSYVVLAASTNYGLKLDDVTATNPDRIYWTMIAQNGLVVLGGGFAGNLFFDAMKNHSISSEPKKEHGANYPLVPTQAIITDPAAQAPHQAPIRII